MMHTYGWRFLRYCLGLFCLALGVTFSIKSQLGVSPINSLPFVLSRVTSIELGVVTTLVFTVYVLLQWLILGRAFKIIQLLQIIVASLFGYFVTLSNFMFQGLQTPDGLIERLLLLSISIGFVAFGLLQYLRANVISQPPEGLVIAIAKRLKWPVPKMKVVFDCTVVLAAIVVSLVAFGEVQGVGLGTLLSAVMIGKTLQLFTALWDRYTVHVSRKVVRTGR